MSNRLRVGLIGAGRIGKGHAETLAGKIPDDELVVIADVNGEAARAVAEAVHIGRWTTDPYAVISDPGVDAIVIASSTDTHAPLIIAGAEAGKAVFCEKPIALDLETTDAALAAVERSGILFQIGFQRRFDPAYARAKTLIDSGALGRVEYIRDTMRDPGPPPRAYLEVCGGLYRDMTIHNFDCLRWLMGGNPAEIYAAGSSLVDPMFAELGDIDTSVITMKFGDGALAMVDNSRRSGFGYDVRTEIFGSNGAIMIGRSADLPMVRFDAEGVHTDHLFFFLERFAEAYVEELRAFVRAARSGVPEGPGAADARGALQLAYAAEASRKANLPVDPARWA